MQFRHPHETAVSQGHGCVAVLVKQAGNAFCFIVQVKRQIQDSTVRQIKHSRLPAREWLDQKTSFGQDRFTGQ